MTAASFGWNVRAIKTSKASRVVTGSSWWSNTMRHRAAQSSGRAAIVLIAQPRSAETVVLISSHIIRMTKASTLTWKYDIKIFLDFGSFIVLEHQNINRRHSTPKTLICVCRCVRKMRASILAVVDRTPGGLCYGCVAVNLVFLPVLRLTTCTTIL